MVPEVAESDNFAVGETAGGVDIVEGFLRIGCVITVEIREREAAGVAAGIHLVVGKYGRFLRLRLGLGQSGLISVWIVVKEIGQQIEQSPLLSSNSNQQMRC